MPGDQDNVEPEQDLVVEGQQDQPDAHLQDHGDAVEQQRGGRLLHGEHVEEPVDQLGAVLTVEGFHVDPWQAVGQVPDHPDEDALLQVLDHNGLQRPQDGCQAETYQQRQAEDQELLHEGRQGGGVDHGHRGDGDCQAQDAHADGIDDHYPDVARPGPEQPQESRERRQAVVLLLLGMRKLALNGRLGQRSGGLRDEPFDDDISVSRTDPPGNLVGVEPSVGVLGHEAG